MHLSSCLRNCAMIPPSGWRGQLSPDGRRLNRSDASWPSVQSAMFPSPDNFFSALRKIQTRFILIGMLFKTPDILKTERVRTKIVLPIKDLHMRAFQMLETCNFLHVLFHQKVMPWCVPKSFGRRNNLRLAEVHLDR